MEKESNSFTVAALVKIDVETNKWSEEFAKIYGKYNSVSFCNPEMAMAVGNNGIITLYNSPAAFEDPYNSNVNNFKLYQNHPNPFNPLTVISYHLPVSGYVTLKVCDIIGNEIATLIDENKPAGMDEVEFDGSYLSSGVYFYKLKVGNFVNIKKMILLK
ncbi:MAG: T9SS type A sorting domain-containing protein [Ignavibacterium sp.]|nr:T9SS type A sorting domain-containing protein [Ignavibacterium sp.]